MWNTAVRFYERKEPATKVSNQKQRNCYDLEGMHSDNAWLVSGVFFTIIVNWLSNFSAGN